MTRTVVPLLVLVAVMLTFAPPAHADPKAGLSNDGTTFASTLAEPLFDPDVRWVPGDTRSASFYVRNQASEPAQLSVDILGTSVDSLLQTGDLTISARGGGGTWQETTVSGTHELVSEVGMRAGDKTRVDVTVDFASSSTNESQLRSLDLDFRVRLVQDIGATDPAEDNNINNNGGDSNGVLPGTGAPALWSIILGLTFVAGGITLASRRREEVEPHVRS